MSERLENFIRNNRKEFIELQPPADLWHKIEQELDMQEKIKPLNSRRFKVGFLLKLAASIVVVIAAGLLFFPYQKRTATDISKINPQLARQQVHYVSLIEDKRNELKEIEKEDPHLYKEFSSEIKAMDENYERLKKELSTSPNQEETVKAMVKNLQIQIQVLNQQLQIIEQVNQFKKGERNEMQSI